MCLLINTFLVNVTFAVSLFFPILTMLKLFAVYHRWITLSPDALLLFLTITPFGFV